MFPASPVNQRLAIAADDFESNYLASGKDRRACGDRSALKFNIATDSNRDHFVCMGVRCPLSVSLRLTSSAAVGVQQRMAA